MSKYILAECMAHIDEAQLSSLYSYPNPHRNSRIKDWQSFLHQAVHSQGFVILKLEEAIGKRVIAINEATQPQYTE